MNQILSVDIGNNKKNKKTGTKSIVVVFCIILILFALAMTGIGVYSYMKNNENKERNGLDIKDNTKPKIVITRENANTISVEVSHDKGISYFEYTINNGEAIRTNENNKMKFNEKIILKEGPYKLNIIVEDIAGITSEANDSGIAGQTSEANDSGIAGQTSEANNSDISGQNSTGETQGNEVDNNNGEGPKITLTKEDAKIKAVTESTTNIEKIIYYWDDNKENAVENKINATKNETLIDVTLEGIHTLYVTATDVEGKSTTVQQKIQGVNKPNVDITTDGENFYIKATDTEMITKVEITLNKNDKTTEEVNNKEYSKNIALENGENRLIVTVYNNNNVEKTLKVKYTK